MYESKVNRSLSSLIPAQYLDAYHYQDDTCSNILSDYQLPPPQVDRVSESTRSSGNTPGKLSPAKINKVVVSMKNYSTMHLVITRASPVVTKLSDIVERTLERQKKNIPLDPKRAGRSGFRHQGP
jgi:hypothetical protein